MPAFTVPAASLDLTVDPASPQWLERTMALLDQTGFAIVLDIVSEEDRHLVRSGFERVRSAQSAALSVDPARQRRAREDRDLRAPMQYDPTFLKLLEYPHAVALIDRYLSPTATLRFQQGAVVPGRREQPNGPWHMNFRRVLNGYRAALEVGYAIDAVDPGSYYFALGSHQQAGTPSAQALEAAGCTFAIPAGAMFVFDGTLWHREGLAESTTDRHMVMQQFVPHFVKPHIDYVRLLGAPLVASLAPRTKRLLGWDSRVPASLDEFYADPDDRLYLPDQG